MIVTTYPVKKLCNKWVDEFKYLGIMLDRKFKRNQHVNKLTITI